MNNVFKRLIYFDELLATDLFGQRTLFVSKNYVFSWPRFFDIYNVKYMHFPQVHPLTFKIYFLL